MAKINIFKKSFQSFIKIIVASMYVCQTIKRPERCKCFSDETLARIPLNIWTYSIPTKHKWISDTAEKPLHQWCDSKTRKYWKPCLILCQRLLQNREERMKIFIVYFVSILYQTETVHVTIMRQESFGSLCITVNGNISAACWRLKAPNTQAEGL